MMHVMARGADGTRKTWRGRGAVALGAMLALAWAVGGAGPTGAASRAAPVLAERAAAAPPTLLATAPDESTGFLLRPGFMIFDQNRPNWTPDYLAGPGLTQQGFEDGRQPPIVWTRWGSRAVGRASYWIGHHTPCSGCRYTPRVVGLAAWRVVQGHYTRFSISYLTGRGATYVLAQVRVPASGVAGGVPAYAWCSARKPKSCSPP